MIAATSFYMDESGAKHPDHHPKLPSHNRDWFAQGGILIDDENIPIAKKLLLGFRERWPQMGNAPLHSYEIRNSTDNFVWLGERDTKSKFLTDLGNVLLSLPVTGIACVIDRPGYNQRYGAQYGDARWSLCKTAFAIAIERAAKQSVERGRKLRVYVERSSKADEELQKKYYDTLKHNGPWFNEKTSAPYSPMNQANYLQVLYEFKIKQKTSLLMQVADMYLWPMCIGGYDKNNRVYADLIKAGRLIDCLVKDHLTLGIKYSCFETVNKNP